MTRVGDRIDIRAVKKRLHALDRTWDEPAPWGQDAWFIMGNGKGIIVSLDLDSEPGVEWLHASFSYKYAPRYPSYMDLKLLHQAVFGEGHAYQCFVPRTEHVNITDNVLHLWGRLDGAAVLPNFGRHGTI